MRKSIYNLLMLSRAFGSGGGSGGSGGGSTEEWIGDGNTHVWITVDDGRTSIDVGFAVVGTATIDWGDGTEPDVVTGTYDWQTKKTNHIYAQSGDYVISIIADGALHLTGVDQNGNLIATSANPSSSNAMFRKPFLLVVKKVEVGRGVFVSSQAFGNYYNLTSVYLPETIESVGVSAFCYCYNLTSLSLPDGLTMLPQYMLADCYRLSSVRVPASVTSIESFAFCNAYGLQFLDFTKHSAVPTIRTSDALAYIAPDLQIRVPAALYDEWIAATNWSTYASQIVAV